MALFVDASLGGLVLVQMGNEWFSIPCLISVDKSSDRPGVVGLWILERRYPTAFGHSPHLDYPRVWCKELKSLSLSHGVQRATTTIDRVERGKHLLLCGCILKKVEEERRDHCCFCDVIAMYYIEELCPVETAHNKGWAAISKG